ncbi:IS1380 family transposase [Rhodococcus jostii]|uniref:IS1380 family transposase n=1 Tax=Rhodococcus jostii TaxID=132919 RepID=UPI000317D72C
MVHATGVLDLSGWPDGMRVIIRKARPHPGAQLPLPMSTGLRQTAFITNSARGELADLELRHHRRARCEVSIRTAEDTGLINLPLHGFAQNQIWARGRGHRRRADRGMQILALIDNVARRWEPKRPRLCLFSIAGRIARHAR